MNHHHAILHLSLIDGIGPVTLNMIIAHLHPHHAWHTLYDFRIADWCALGLQPSLAQQVYTGLQNRVVLDQEISLMERHGISLITIIDDAYPPLLRSIHVPPPVIYYRGTLAHRRSLAVIGSRQANEYGKKISESFIPLLVAQGYTIVSGGAIGADSMAHRAAINAGGSTIVVLGSGLLKPYPYQNKQLFDEVIAHDGAMISIFPLHASPLPGNFIARNRVIAGLAHGVVVIQAALHSGTRSTAQFALEQGRDVFAVPGPFDDPLSAGCHALIQQGAKLTVQVEDILEEYTVLQKDKSLVQSIGLPQRYPSL